jgi:hypothetical protein
MIFENSVLFAINRIKTRFLIDDNAPMQYFCFSRTAIGWVQEEEAAFLIDLLRAHDGAARTAMAAAASDRLLWICRNSKKVDAGFLFAILLPLQIEGATTAKHIAGGAVAATARAVHAAFRAGQINCATGIDWVSLLLRRLFRAGDEKDQNEVLSLARKAVLRGYVFSVTLIPFVQAQLRQNLWMFISSWNVGEG